jgi:hypothetical protein
MKNYYKLVGAVNIKDNIILNDLVLSDYIITDNNTIVSTINYENNKTFDENFYGINYNSRKLDLDTTSVDIDVDDIFILPFSFYLYEWTFTDSIGVPFVINTKYLVYIENQTGYLIRNSSNLITLLILNKIKLQFNQ